MLLSPNAELFATCYGEWLADVAQFVVGAPSGLTIGIYGRWGSGKSSACKALVSEIYRLSDSNNSYVEAGIFDAALINKNPTTIDQYISEVIDNLKLEPQKLESKRKVREFLGSVLKKFAPAANAAVSQMAQIHSVPSEEAKLTGQITQASLEITSDLIKEDTNSSDKQKCSKEEDIPFNRFIIIIDDLDRCNPSDAIQALAAIDGAIGKLKYTCDTIVILACDPEILARHASYVFGISLSEGLEGITKYIHAPFHLPTGKTRHHHGALENFIKLYPGIQSGIADEILNTAEMCVGNLPIREVLSAIPQAILWSQRAAKVLANDYSPSHCKILFVAALISINIPGLLRQTRGLSTLLAALKTHANSSDKPYSDYGTPTLELAHIRTDISHISRILIGGVSSVALEQAYPVIMGYGTAK